MKKKIFSCISPVTVIVFILNLCSFWNVNAENLFAEAVKASGEGNVNGIITNSGDIITGDADAATMAKAYTMLAIGYTLQADDDAKDRCSGLIDLIPDEVSEESPALPVLKLLAGEIKISDLEKEVTNASPDWKAVAAVAMYYNAVRDKA